MDSSASTSTQKRQNQEGKTFGCMVLKVHHKKLKLNEEFADIDQDLQELHRLKENLRKEIADLKKSETEVISDKERFARTLLRLEQGVLDNKKYCAENSTEPDIEEMVRQYHWADVNIINGYRKIKETEMNLRVWSKLIISEEKNQEKSDLDKSRSVMIELPDIDSFGIIKKNGSVKVGNEIKCCLCLKNDIDCILYKCGHECCCYDCISQTRNKKKGCPLCHKIIKTAAKIFHP